MKHTQIPIGWRKTYSFNMKTFLLFLLLLFSLACTNSTQNELVMSKAIGDYVDAINDQKVLIELGLLHPRVVKFYTDQGIDTVKKYFEENRPYIQNYYKTKSFSAAGFECLEYTYKVEDKSHNFYALKQEGQKNWLFIDERDKKLFPELFNQ